MNITFYSYFALKSLLSRKVTSSVSIFLIASSVALFTGVEQVRSEIRNGFEGSIRGVDLIVGAKGGKLQLLLYSVFHIGGPVENISLEDLHRLEKDPRVKHVIPLSAGDSFRGYSVIATTEEYFREFRYRDKQQLVFARGESFQGSNQVVLGAGVARTSGASTGDSIKISHGISHDSLGLPGHDHHRFQVSGILAPTATPVDDTLYISLTGMEAVHAGWKDGAPPRPGEEPDEHDLEHMDLEPREVSAAYVILNSPVDALTMEREISQKYNLMAVMPGRTMSEFWKGISYVERGLTLISGMVVIVGLSGMFLGLFSSLDSRRYEMAILRAVGASPRLIFFLLQIEALFIVSGGILLSFALRILILFFAGDILQDTSGIRIQGGVMTGNILLFYGASFIAGWIAGILPGWKAYRTTLSDGLNP